MMKQVIDLKRAMKPFNSASAAKPVIVDVPRMNVILVDGMGDPNGTSFQEAAGALYSVAYTMKARRDNWKWTLFIGLPDVVTKSDFAGTVAMLKKNAKLPGSGEVRFEKFAEGKAAQIPRNLSRRPAALGPGKPEDDHPPSGGLSDIRDVINK